MLVTEKTTDTKEPTIDNKVISEQLTPMEIKKNYLRSAKLDR